jgi:hypothetical protein
LTPVSKLLISLRDNKGFKPWAAKAPIITPKEAKDNPQRM